MGKRKLQQKEFGDRGQSDIKPLRYALPIKALRSWPKIFRRRRNIQLGVENKSHVTGRAESGEDEIDDMIRIFMREPEESLGCLPRADRIEEFCFEMSIDSLRKADVKQDETRVIAWLDDRNLDCPLEPSEAHCQPLTAYELFRQLEQPRFPSAGPLTPPVTGNRTTLLDADRRLIFITNLDRYSIYALVRTASTHQATALRGALYHHLEFEASLELAARMEGFPMFRLAFHLPFFAVRTSETPQTDCRRDRNKIPLRRRQDISFLNWQADAPSIYLYDAQVSCVITGFDWTRWIAWLFIDTYYFDPGDESEEDVSEYYEDGLSPAGMRADPLTYGLLDADKPIWDPEDYFLTVLKTRFAQVKREWKGVVTKLKSSFRHHHSTHQYRLWSPASGDAERESSHGEELRRSLDWVLLFMHLAKEVNETLSKTLKAYEPFCSRRAGDFVGGLRFPPEHKLLPSIQETFDELCQLRETLDHLLDRCGQYTKELEFKLNLEVREMNTQQLRLALEANRIAEDNKGFSWIILIYVTPLALTSSVFSMQPTVIPVPPTFGWFLALIAILFCVGFLVLTTWFCRWGQVLALTWQYYCAVSCLLRMPRRKRHIPTDEETGSSTTSEGSSV
ncbi:hypothetical protein AYO21_02607 [Fonsecaea monophora]|uniref:Uncharacterized protein n=1 Tax=Fonsecaea monophora TaxID=254056 RepID=A0A177FHV1_9EURO|nr:hypothetical protein AYO21_02607 [Fonsecaea monophora]KAH0847219.1 hypothetical protein FOPE_00346 [Fonsecaea pedrosoi]OAG43321.1 hypothetical protein AYO21_02607 [Fonsecaea monophora]